MGSNGVSAITGSYGNYSAYNDDFLAQQLLKNNAYADSIYNTPPAQPQDSVSFSGKTDSEKDAEGSSGLGTVVVAGGLAIGAFMLGKNWNAVKGWANKILNGKTAAKVKTTLQKAKTKAWECIQPNKKAKIKGTSVTGAAKPVSNATEARVMQNINTQHVNGNTQRVVQNSMNDIVTPEMQAAYDKSIAYKPLTQKQKSAKAVIDAQNKAQRAELNAIKNNSKGAEQLASVTQAAQKAETVAKHIKDGAHLNPANKNIYFTTGGKVTQIRTAVPNSKGEYVITDPLKIAKHLEKQQINLESFCLG